MKHDRFRHGGPELKHDSLRGGSGVGHEDAWRDSMEQHPIESCGELDVATTLTGKVTVGRVSSAIIRYVYFEDGSEVVCVGAFADFVAFQAADYHKRIAELEDQLQDLNDELDQWREATTTEGPK